MCFKPQQGTKTLGPSFIWGREKKKKKEYFDWFEKKNTTLQPADGLVSVAQRLETASLVLCVRSITRTF